MLRKFDYFKLGSFIIIGSALLISMIIILGAGRYFEQSFLLECYFDESLNGLEIGSPVKLRGVKVGRVANIDFVNNKYVDAEKSDIRYVYVECDINPHLFGDLSHKEFIRAINREVARGLRVQPTSLGLTGQLFLNFAYVDPDSNPPLHVDWDPKEAYIPSMPSTMNRIEQAIANISKTMSAIKQEDIEVIFRDVKSILASINRLINTEGGQQAANRIQVILDNLAQIFQRTNQLMADPAMASIIPEAASALKGINKIVTNSADDVILAAREASHAMASLKTAGDVLAKNLSDPRTDKALSNIAPTLENIAQASADLTAALTKVHTLTNRLNSVVASEEANIHSIISDTREVMQNIKELSGDAKRYPSGVFFGNPPSKATPEKQ